MKILLLNLLFLSACTSLSKKDCQSLNWEKRGELDGKQGSGPERFSKWEQSCQEHGVGSNKSAYLKGRTKGLRSFCTEENGYYRGKLGYSSGSSVCPEGLRKLYIRGYISGDQLRERLEYQERRDQKEDEFREKELNLLRQSFSPLAPRSCNSSFDCTNTGSCQKGFCTNMNSRSCFSNMDCEFRGRCRNQRFCEYSL